MTQMVSVPSETITHLPPLDAWKVNPNKVKKFYAPTDDRGFVLPHATIEAVLDLFHEDYRWPVDWSKAAPQVLRPDDHHFHWIAEWYERSHFKGKNSSVPRHFRELPSNRGIIPRQFHNVLHEVTLPPMMPKIGHMDHYLRSFAIARQLFDSAQKALMAESLFMGTSEEYKLEEYLKKYESHFKSYNKDTIKALGIRALDVIGVGNVNLESVEEVRHRLGSCALINTPNYTYKYFTQSLDVAA